MLLTSYVGTPNTFFENLELFCKLYFKNSNCLSMYDYYGLRIHRIGKYSKFPKFYLFLIKIVIVTQKALPKFQAMAYIMKYYLLYSFVYLLRKTHYKKNSVTFSSASMHPHI